MKRAMGGLVAAVWALAWMGCSGPATEGNKVLDTTEGSKALNTKVTIKTSLGDMTVELFDQKAPESVKNFLAYVDSGHFRGTVFHRVINGFMIQGGGFTKDLQQKPTQAPIRNEAGNGEKNTRGTLAMARTMDVNSATAQFFINVADNTFLDHKDNTARGFGYCVFGRVVDGMSAVDAIRAVKTGRVGPLDDVPMTPVEILDVVRVP